MEPLEFFPGPGALLHCELCQQAGGVLVAATPEWRVIRAVDANFPVFYRVIWQAHVSEFTDLDVAARTRCMEVVAALEATLRRCVQPTKVNLATLGNVVAHLHWHVIARFDWDSHYPQPVWGAAQRKVDPAPEHRLSISLAALDGEVRRAVLESALRQ